MSTDNFTNVQSCDTVANFNADQGASVTLAQNTTDNLEGTGAVDITAGGSPQLIEVGANVTAFNIKQNNLVVWCNYSKGKTAQFLTDSASALRIRCYFGGTTPASTPYAEWDQGGNLDLPFGWAPYYASGTTASRLGNGHNGTTDYDSTVQRVSLILDQANNNSGTNDPPFITDYWHAGTKIQLTGGSVVSPLTEDDIITYDSNNNLGVVIQDRSQKALILRCGIDIGDGTTPGYAEIKDIAILNDQLSDEVEQEWNVIDNTGGASTLILGELETGTDSSYAVKGCQISCPATRNPDFDAQTPVTYECYDSLFFRWGVISIGGTAAGTGGSRVLRLVDIDACESINFNKAGTYSELEIHDNAQRVQQHAGEVRANIVGTPFTALVHNNDEGLHYRAPFGSHKNVIHLDNTTYDLRVLEGTTNFLDNCVFSILKVARQAT